MNNNKNISSSNIGENLSPHKYQSSVVNISKPLEDILSELCLDFDSDDYFNTIEEVKEDEDFKQSLEKIQEIINQAILNERTKTLEIMEDIIGYDRICYVRSTELENKVKYQNELRQEQRKALEDLKGKL